MAKKILLGIVVVLVLFFGYVSTRSGSFRYENSTVINAPADKIFPYLSNFKMGGEWNPYEKVDPDMKKTFNGPDGQAGATFDFEGNKDAGSGRLEMLQVKPNEFVQMKLTMTKPFSGEQMIEYKLAPEGPGTRFTWTMYGEGGFMTKLMSVLIDCEKMFKTQMDKGFENLKKVTETAQAPAPATPALAPIAPPSAAPEKK